jgi:hypothetical protein
MGGLDPCTCVQGVMMMMGDGTAVYLGSDERQAKNANIHLLRSCRLVVWQSSLATYSCCWLRLFGVICLYDFGWFGRVTTSPNPLSGDRPLRPAVDWTLV